MDLKMKNGKEVYDSGLSGKEVNDLILEHLFTGEAIKEVEVRDNKDNKINVTLSYVPLNSGDSLDLMKYYRFKPDEEIKNRYRQLVECAFMLRKINGKDLASELFLPSHYEKHLGDEVVNKNKVLFSDAGTEIRDLVKNPLSEFEKRYLVLRDARPVMLEVFYTTLMADSYEVINTIFGLDENKSTEGDSLISKDKDNSPLQ